MDTPPFIAELHTELTITFAAVDAWFDESALVREFQPADQGWTIDEVLTHIALTNHFLLILIEKGTTKASANALGADLAGALTSYELPRERLAAIGVLHAFAWERPAHMEPRTARQPLADVRQQLKQQLTQARACLDRLPHGEGLLYQTTMTVNGLGKLNVYEYVYFLAQHARRHLTQLQENAAEHARATA